MARGKKTGGGSRKGIPNTYRLETREALWDYIRAQGPTANPFKRLVDRMMTTDNEATEVNCASILADRLLPRLKAVEVSGNEAQPLRVLLEALDGQPYAAVHHLLYPEGEPLRLPHETA